MIKKNIYGKNNLLTILLTNTDIYVVVFIIVAAVFFKTSCVFLIYLLISLNYLKNIFFFFAHKERKYETDTFINRILQPHHYAESTNPKTSQKETKLTPQNGLPPANENFQDNLMSNFSRDSNLQPQSSTLSGRSGLTSMRSMFLRNGLISFLAGTRPELLKLRTDQKQFVLRKNRLGLWYVFYKQVEYQRLLYFNIFFGVFYIAASKLMFLLKNSNTKSLFSGPSFQFSLKFFGLDLENDSFGNSVNLFVFLNMLFLVLNKIFIENLKIEQKLFKKRKLSKLLDDQSRKPSEDDNLLKIPENTSEKQKLKSSSPEENQKKDSEIKEKKPDKDPNDGKWKKPPKNKKKKKYKSSPQILEYYSGDLALMRIFKKIIQFLPFILLLILLFINIQNESIFTLIFLIFILLTFRNPAKMMSWLLVLLITKLVIVYISYLMFFDGEDLNDKDSAVNVYTLFINISWIKIILYQIIIGRNFFVSIFFIESLLILFFVFSQKITMLFHSKLEKTMLSKRRQLFENFETALAASSDVDPPLPKIDYLPVFLDYSYSFFVCNCYSFLFLISLFLMLFTKLDLVALIWNLVAFVLFLRFEIFWNRKKLSAEENSVITKQYAKSLTYTRYALNIALLFLQTLKFVASRLEMLDWINSNLSDYSYVLLIFFIVLLFDKIVQSNDFEDTLKSFDFFEKIRKNIIIRMRVNETYIKAIENKLYQLMLEENKKNNLQKLFSIIGKEVINKKRKEILECGGRINPEKLRQLRGESKKNQNKESEDLDTDPKPTKENEIQDTKSNKSDNAKNNKEFNKKKLMALDPKNISNSDEIINVYSIGLKRILTNICKSNKYFYFNLLEMFEFMFHKKNIRMKPHEKFEFLCSFATKDLKDNRSFKILKKALDINPEYMESLEIPEFLQDNPFNLSGTRHYLKEDPPILHIVKRWIYHWVIMNIDFFSKLAIVILCTIDGSLFLKVAVIYFVFVDFSMTVSNTRFLIFYFYFAFLLVIKAIAFYILPLLPVGLLANQIAATLHSFIGDFSFTKTIAVIFLLTVVHLFDKFKGKEAFYKFFIKNNFFSVFSKIRKKKKTYQRIIRKYFDLDEEKKNTSEKRIQIAFFKMKLIFYFKKAVSRMHSFMHSRYLFNRKMGPNFDNPFENIFHPYVFKSGVEIYDLIFVLQLVFSLFMFVFWKNMFTTSSALLESITSSELPASLVVFVLIVAACMLIDAILINTNSAEYNRVQRFVRQADRKDSILKKFKRIVLKMININRIKKKHVIIQKSYDQKIVKKVAESFSKTNPTYPKFIYTLILCLAFNLFLFVMLLKKKLALAASTNQPMNAFMNTLSSSDNAFVLTAEILFLGYLMMSVLFVRYGLRMKHFYKSDQLGEYEVKLMEKLNSVPYFRELRVYLFWTARKTSLDFKDWFIIDYCYFQLMDKFEKEYETKEDIKPMPKWYKLFCGLGPLVLIMLVLLGPLVIFSSFNPINTPNSIKSFSTDLSIEIDDFGIFPLYQMENSKVVSEMKEKELARLKTKVDFLAEVPLSRIRTISLTKISPSLFEINPKTLTDIQDALLTNKEENAIKIHMKMSLEELDGPKVITQEYELSREQAMSLYGIFTCRSPSSLTLPHFMGSILKVIAGEEGNVVSLIPPSKKYNNTEFMHNLVLSAECGDEGGILGIKYFQVESDRIVEGSTDETEPISFNVILDLYSDTIKKFFGATSLIAFYVTFVFVMGFKLRDLIEINLGSIRFETIVQNKLVLGLIEAIEQAKNNKNFIKEKILFVYLLEIMRSGGLFNRFSGSLEPTKYRDKYIKDVLR